MLFVTFFSKPGVPFKPMLKDVRDKKCGAFEVTWEPPSFESGGGPITSYEAQVRIENVTWRNCSTTSINRRYLFEGLVKDAKYLVRVRALNKKGQSEWSGGPLSVGFSGMLYEKKLKGINFL